MRSFRPSSKSIAVAGVLAAALVVAGTSGAVAGRLITSHDIKNGTIQAKDLKDDAVTNEKIAPGAVSWDKSLSSATKAQIKALLSAGTPGPAGEPGPAGPSGASGARGQAGPAGSGQLVAYDLYSPFSEPDTEDGSYQLTSYSGSTIELTDPGSYLVTVQGAFLDPAMDSYLSLGQAYPDDDTLLNACVPADAMNLTPGEDNPIALCDTTYTLAVSAGDPQSLPVFSNTPDCTDDSCLTPAFAKVVIYKMTDEVPVDPTPPCARSSVTHALKMAHPNASRRSC